MGKPHEEMDKIARMLPYVSHKEESIDIAEPIDPSKLLPGKPSLLSLSPSFYFVLFFTTRPYSRRQAIDLRWRECVYTRTEEWEKCISAIGSLCVPKRDYIFSFLFTLTCRLSGLSGSRKMQQTRTIYTSVFNSFRVHSVGDSDSFFKAILDSLVNIPENVLLYRFHSLTNIIHTRATRKHWKI